MRNTDNDIPDNADEDEPFNTARHPHDTTRRGATRRT